MIAATLHGPNYWAPNHDEHTIEVFENLGAAIEALIERYRSNGQRQCEISYLDGTTESSLFPAFEIGTYLQCYTIEGHVDRIPDEVQVMNTLSAVHGGYRDWALFLSTAEGDDLAVVAVPA